MPAIGGFRPQDPGDDAPLCPPLASSRARRRSASEPRSNCHHTSSTTTSPSTSSTSTSPSLPGTESQWRFYVQIALLSGKALNVNVPRRSGDSPIEAAIPADVIPAFPVGGQTSGTEVAALGGDTLQQLSSATQTYMFSHPLDYPNLAGLVALRWAMRVRSSDRAERLTPSRLKAKGSWSGGDQRHRPRGRGAVGRSPADAARGTRDAVERGAEVASRPDMGRLTHALALLRELLAGRVATELLLPSSPSAGTRC